MCSVKVLICSTIVFQAISAQDEKLSQTMFLPLAERMVEKMVKEEKIEAEAEVRTFFLLKLDSCLALSYWRLGCCVFQVQLYFMILERLGKYNEALEVLRGQLGGEDGAIKCG